MHTRVDKLKDLQKAVKALPGQKVYVGIPAERTTRSGDLTNAQLGYLHEFGAPEVGLPARPSLIPGIRDAQPKIGVHLMAAGKAGLNGDQRLKERHMMAAGQVAADSVRATITRGIPPPLADSTLENRARRKKGSGHRIAKGATAELAARGRGAEPGTSLAKPLIDSAQFLHAITHVLRKS